MEIKSMPQDLNKHNHSKFFPLNSYANELGIINGVRFTRREIDIVACISAGKTTKASAALLTISPRTVENHIRNIMLRLGCGTQEKIIDFIENSDKYKLVRSHYNQLLIQEAFESNVKKIAKNLSPKKGLMIQATGNNNLDLFSLQIQQHLNLAGINILIECDEQNNKINHALENVKSGILDFALCYITKQLVESLDFPSSFIELDLDKEKLIGNIKANIEKDKAEPENGIFLLFRLNEPKDKKTKPLSFEYIDISDHKNYYVFLFELLRILFPSETFEKEIIDFEQKYKQMNDPVSIKSTIEVINNSSQSSPTKAEKGFVHKLIKRSVTVITITLLVLLMLDFKEFLFSHSTSLSSTFKHENTSINSDPFSVVSTLKEGKTFYWNLPRQDNVFIGRADLLASIKDEFDDIKHLKNNRSDTLLEESNTLVFTGLGGIGKTQLALNYAYQAKDYIAKIWFSANNLDALNQNYTEFAKALGYEEKESGSKDAINYVKKWLEKNRGWLVVFDSVNNYKEIEPFLPETGGHIIITSRYRNWPTKFNLLPVHEMSEEESLDLLATLSKKRIDPTDKEVAKELIKTLGYLPLALAQASTYIKQNQIGLKEYLTLYKKYETQLLEENNLPDMHSLPVAIVWKVTLDSILNEVQKNTVPAVELDILKICSLLSSHKIPERMLLTWLMTEHPEISTPELVLNKCISLLWEYSLINRDETNTLSMHKLVQSIIRRQFLSLKDQTDSQYQWYEALLHAMDLEFNRETSSLEEEQRQQALLPHLQSLIEYHQQNWPQELSEKLADVLMDVGMVFDRAGQPEVAKDNFLKALEIFEKKHGKIHPKVIVAKRYLGRAYRHLEEPTELPNSKKILEEILALQQKYYPNETLEINLTIAELAYTYGELGDSLKKTKLLEQVLPILEKHYGKYSLKIADVLRSLARVKTDLGSFNESNKIFEQSLAIAKSHYGEEHPQLAKSLHNYANNFLELGQYDKAMELYEQALKIKEKFYGLDHPTVAITLNAMGRTSIEMGEAKKAIKLIEKALSIKEKYYDKAHRQMSLVHHNLGNAYKALNESKKAEKLLKSVLYCNEQIYGKDHPKTAIVLCDLGGLYAVSGNVNEAKTSLINSLEILENFYGKTHLKVAKNLYSLALTYSSLKENAQACEASQRCYDILLKHYGEEHMHTKRALALVEKCYREFNASHDPIHK